MPCHCACPFDFRLTPQVDDYAAAGGFFVALSVRNLEAALFPLFKKKHFPHVNMLRECVGHVKQLSGIWADCPTTATTPIPFPYVQLAKAGVPIGLLRGDRGPIPYVCAMLPCSDLAVGAVDAIYFLADLAWAEKNVNALFADAVHRGGPGASKAGEEPPCVVEEVSI